MIIASNKTLLIGLGIAAGALVAFIVYKGGIRGAAQAVGAGAVDAVGGVLSGAGGAVADAANNQDINPLQPLGSAIGIWLYDLTHPDQPK